MILIMLILAPAASTLAITDDYENEDETGEGAEEIGSIAAWGGIILIGGFVLFREAYMRFLRPAKLVRPEIYKNAISLHAITSIVLGIIGLYHGYTLLEYAGPIEYGLASIIIFTLITGSMLWVSRGKIRRYIRLIHVQRALAISITTTDLTDIDIYANTTIAICVNNSSPNVLQVSMTRCITNQY